MPTNCIFAIDGYLALGTSTPGYGDKLRIKQGGNTQYAIWLENNTTAQAITLGIFDCVARIQTDYAAIGDIPLQIQSYTSACMYFKPAGGIGINTTSPSYKLDIGGSGPSFGMSSTSATGYNEMYFSRNTSTVVGYIGVGVNAAVTSNGDDFVIQNRLSTGNLVLHTNTTERMRVTCAGNIGIGTCTPSEKLHLYCASSVEMRFENSTMSSYLRNQSDNFNFYINNAERIRITCAGNVGINCSAPSYKLHVNGTFYAAGSSQDYKQSICNYNTDSCMFMKLKPVTYQYKEEYCHLGKELKSGTQIGLIAEEVAETYPELAILVNEEENKVVRNVDYEKLSVILLSEVQKLRREVDDLKHKQ